MAERSTEIYPEVHERFSASVRGGHNRLVFSQLIRLFCDSGSVQDALAVMPPLERESDSRSRRIISIDGKLHTDYTTMVATAFPGRELVGVTSALCQLYLNDEWTRKQVKDRLAQWITTREEENEKPVTV